MADGYWCSDPHLDLTGLSTRVFARMHWHPPIYPASALMTAPPPTLPKDSK
jgi:hypothetical protein